MNASKILIVLAVAGLTLSGCGGNGGRDKEIAYRDVQIKELEGQVGDLKRDLGARDAELDELRKKQSEGPVVASGEDDLAGLRRRLAQAGAEVKWRHGELVITMADDILFTPGAATLTGSARGRLGHVASVVKERYAGHYVRVEGHTDSDPIRRTKDKWEDNWHLSGARARAVLHYLIDQGGMPGSRVSFAGYADTRAVSSNSSSSGKSKNRRVEIVVLPKLDEVDDSKDAEPVESDRPSKSKASPRGRHSR